MEKKTVCGLLDFKFPNEKEREALCSETSEEKRTVQGRSTLVLVLKLSFGQGFGLSGRTRGQKEFQKVKAAEKGNWKLEVEQKQ